LNFHGLDAMDVVHDGTPVIRDEKRRQIRYPAVVGNGPDLQFVTAVEQGEGAPLPWPEVLR